MNDLLAAVTAVDEPFSQEVTESFVQYAIGMGWPEVIARMVIVRCHNGVFSCTYGNSDAVDPWEFGDQTRAPLPAIRRFMNQVEREFGEVYTERVVSTLWKGLV